MVYVVPLDQLKLMRVVCSWHWSPCLSILCRTRHSVEVPMVAADLPLLAEEGREEGVRGINEYSKQLQRNHKLPLTRSTRE